MKGYELKTSPTSNRWQATTAVATTTLQHNPHSPGHTQVQERLTEAHCDIIQLFYLGNCLEALRAERKSALASCTTA
jgi:hypothetical protein